VWFFAVGKKTTPIPLSCERCKRSQLTNPQNLSPPAGFSPLGVKFFWKKSGSFGEI
jgi:hypothetical protein